MQNRLLAGKMRPIFRVGMLCLLLSFFSCDPSFDPENPPAPPPPPPIVTVDFVEG